MCARVCVHVVCHFINFIKLKINSFLQVSLLVYIKEKKSRIFGETVSEKWKAFPARMNKLNKMLSLLGRMPVDVAR